jgi:hypothetical protein
MKIKDLIVRLQLLDPELDLSSLASINRKILTVNGNQRTTVLSERRTLDVAQAQTRMDCQRMREYCKEHSARLVEQREQCRRMRARLLELRAQRALPARGA